MCGVIGRSRNPTWIEHHFLDLVGVEPVFSNMVDVVLVPVKQGRVLLRA